MPSDLVQAFVDCWQRVFLETFEAQGGGPIAGEGLPADATAGSASLVGLEQPFEQIPGGAFWIGVTAAQADEAGGLLLTGEQSAEKLPRDALFKVLQSALGAASPKVAPKFQLGNAQPIALKTFEAAEANCFTPLRFNASGVQFEIYVGISPQLRQWVEQRAAAQCSSGSALDRLFDVELPVSFSFGRKKLALKDVLNLAPSSVVELDRAPDDLVEVIVNDSVIAWGEVVSIDGQYGIRIRRIAPGGVGTSAMSAPPAVRALVEA